MAEKKDEINIRSSAAEYLTYIASAGEQENSFAYNNIRRKACFSSGLTLKSDMLVNHVIDRWRTTLKLAQISVKHILFMTVERQG